MRRPWGLVFPERVAPVLVLGAALAPPALQRMTPYSLEQGRLGLLGFATVGPIGRAARFPVPALIRVVIFLCCNGGPSGDNQWKAH